jgi:hypothetical protein
MKMVKMTVYIFYLTNIAACVAFFVPSFNDFEGDNWVKDMDILDSPPNHQFLVSFYWAYQTLLTIGYGDITPISTPE